MRWNTVTALFGGSFDPPHRGHREAVRGLFQVPGVRAVRVIPTAMAAHKAVNTPSENRVAMAQLNFQALPGDSYPPEVKVDLLEIERARREPGPTYSYDTIQAARTEFGEVAFVIGTDQLRDLPTWHRFPQILGLCHWIVLVRKPDGAKVAGEILREWVNSGLLGTETAAEFLVNRALVNSPFANPTVLRLVPTDAPALSSTEIRETLQKSGNPPAGSLLAAVSSYLKEAHLYGS